MALVRDLKRVSTTGLFLMGVVDEKVLQYLDA